MIKKFENFSLAERNSFAVSIQTLRLVEFGPSDELIEYMASNAGLLSEKWAVLGGGNNILFTCDYQGTLFHPATEEITVTGEDKDFVRVKVSAGHDWDGFVAWAVEHGLWGVENLSHIPSLTGAAPVQNIGAYGAEVKDVIDSVEIVHTDTLKATTIAGEHCVFGYRDSIFKNLLKGKAIITAVNFMLAKKPSPNTSYGALNEETERLGGKTLKNIRQAVINIRTDKLPDPKNIGNAGSFFKNPVVPAELAAKLKKEYPDIPQYPGAGHETVKLAAGWLIEKAGWKGRREGNVGIYPKQALIVVNHGGATGNEIIGFSDKVRSSVFEMFGIDIEPEVNIW